MQLSGAAEPSLRRSLPLTVREVVVERMDAGGVARRILNRASLLIEPGIVLAVTGPSGAGKTTLLHAIAGLVIPDHGTVSWGDRTITSLSEGERDRWRRNTVGLVFQDFQLLEELGVLENILLPARFDHWRTPRALIERAMMLAERVGLDHRARRVSALSRGEQQRVAIARALVREPQLILADEPTASLDSANGSRIAELLIESARRTQASIVLISHDGDVLRRADRVHQLVAGELDPTLAASS
jgi:putative ABC transport system ATP-binding protein